jgi:hypothetical protein
LPSNADLSESFLHQRKRKQIDDGTLEGGERGWVKVVFGDGGVIVSPFEELKIT